MKKLFFTAITFIAFSSMTLANTISAKENLDCSDQEEVAAAPCSTWTHIYVNGRFHSSVYNLHPTFGCSGMDVKRFDVNIGTGLH